MPLSLEFITAPESYPTLANIRYHAFAANALNQMMYPSRVDPEALKSWFVEREIRDAKNPSQKLIAVIDSEIIDEARGEDGIIAFVKWDFPSCLLGEEVEDVDLGPHPPRPEGTNEDVWRAFRGGLDGMRRKWGDKREVFELHTLATHPSHQRRGAAGMLLRWGTEQADAAGKRIYLESTPEAFPVYAKHGWRRIDESEIDLREFGGEVVRVAIMMREPGAG